MTMTDPIADLLTRIRNAVSINHKRASIPHSRVKEQICRVLKEEGFVNDYRITEEPHKTLHVFLKYGPNGERVIRHIRRISKPGRRVYSGAAKLKPVLNGLGIFVISTSRGVISDREARRRNLGGEVLCEIW